MDDDGVVDLSMMTDAMFADHHDNDGHHGHVFYPVREKHTHTSGKTRMLCCVVERYPPTFLFFP